MESLEITKEGLRAVTGSQNSQLRQTSDRSEFRYVIYLSVSSGIRCSQDEVQSIRIGILIWVLCDYMSFEYFVRHLHDISRVDRRV